MYTLSDRLQPPPLPAPYPGDREVGVFGWPWPRDVEVAAKPWVWPVGSEVLTRPLRASFLGPTQRLSAKVAGLSAKLLLGFLPSASVPWGTADISE